MQRIDLSQEEKKEFFLSVLSYRLGNVTEACKFVGIGRQTYYDWTEIDKKFAAEVAQIQEEVKDFYESKGHELASGLDGAQIRYFLSHKARDRGYGKTPGSRIPSLPSLNLYQQFNIGMPPRPKTLADWEQQIITARDQRLLTEGQPQESIPDTLQETQVRDAIDAEVIESTNSHQQDFDSSKVIEMSNSEHTKSQVDDSTHDNEEGSEET